MTSPPVTDRSSGSPRSHVVKLASVMVVLLVLAGLIAWAMWRRGKLFGGDGGAVWDAPAKAAATSPTTSSNPNGTTPATVPAPGSMPDPAAPATPNLPSTALKKPSPRVRLPLTRPVPEALPETATEPQVRHRRHHRDFLGLGKLWHWIRRDHRKSQE
jgi:hypothetical protein